MPLRYEVLRADDHLKNYANCRAQGEELPTVCKCADKYEIRTGAFTLRLSREAAMDVYHQLSVILGKPQGD